MADWNLPTITSNYLLFVEEINLKFNDAAIMNGSGINLPENTFRYNRSINVFQEWIAGAWVDRVLSIAGGGTGSNTASGIRTNLGLGSMAVQNSNAVNITGGSITGISFDISSITSGVLPLARGGTGASLALAGYGAVLLSSGSAVVFDNGSAIQVLNASNLTMGTVPAARLDPQIAYKNVVNQFIVKQRISNQGGEWPRLTFTDITAPADTRIWELNMNSGSGVLNFWGLNDAENAVLSNIIFHRSGYISAIGFSGALNASNITTGIVAQAHLGSGVANSSTFLRGDQVWAVPPSGGGASGTFVPSGMIGIFDTNCPAGWTRYSQLDGRFPLGSSGAGATGGSNSHSHIFDQQSGHDGDHDHSFGGSFGGSGSGSGNFGGNTGGESNGAMNVDAGNSGDMARANHTHGFNVHVDLGVNVTTNIDGRTGGGGGHSHRVAGGTSGADHTPFYFTVVFCRKD